MVSLKTNKDVGEYLENSGAVFPKDVSIKNLQMLMDFGCIPINIHHIVLSENEFVFEWNRRDISTPTELRKPCEVYHIKLFLRYCERDFGRYIFTYKHIDLLLAYTFGGKFFVRTDNGST